MLWLAVICVSLALSGASEKKHTLDGVRDYKVKAQSAYLDHLDEELTHVEEQLSGLKVEHDLKLVEELHARLEYLQEEDCPKGTHHCGDGSKQCVHELFFCDGHFDCHNLNDEDTKVCEGYEVATGSSFKGVPEWESCHAGGNHELFSFTVTKTKVNPHHGSKVHVEAAVVFGKEAVLAHGSWSVGSRHLLLDLEDEHLSLECDFLTDDVAECKVERTPEEVCASFRVHRA